MILKKASYKAIKYACLKFHYAKSVPCNVFGYSVFNEKKEWCGCIVYGAGANNNAGKCYGLRQGQIIELVRMSLNGKQESTSKALAISLRLIKKDLPLCELIVSYADIDQDHKGIIYQATNWCFTGFSMLNKKDGSWIINGVREHGKTIFDKLKRVGLNKTKQNILKYLDSNAVEYVTKGKIKYLYPLNNKMKEYCKSIQKPYSEINKQQAQEV